MSRTYATILVTVLAFYNGSAIAQSPIVSEFTQFIPVPREKVYQIVANIRNHSTLLRNVRGRLVVPKSKITQDAIRENEEIAISFVDEPSNRIAITRFRFFPPRLIEEEMITNPFDDVGILDKKKGKISYIFEDAPGGTKFTAKSEFYPSTGRMYNKNWIDETWRDFLRRLEEQARQ